MTRSLITPSEVYMAARLNELSEALKNYDTDTAMAVFTRMNADGYGQTADRMVNELILIALKRMAGKY